MIDDQVSSLEHAFTVMDSKVVKPSKKSFSIMPKIIYEEIKSGLVNTNNLSQAFSNYIEEIEADKEKRERFIPEVVMFT